MSLLHGFHANLPQTQNVQSFSGGHGLCDAYIGLRELRFMRKNLPVVVQQFCNKLDVVNWFFLPPPVQRVGRHESLQQRHFCTQKKRNNSRLLQSRQIGKSTKYHKLKGKCLGPIWTIKWLSWRCTINADCPRKVYLFNQRAFQGVTLLWRTHTHTHTHARTRARTN